MFIALMSAAGAALLSSPVADPHAAVTTPMECELHVWPALRMDSLGEGWVLNDVENRALRVNPVPLPTLLPPDKQIQLLSSIDLANLIGRKGYHVTFHSDVPPWRAPGSPHIRRTPSTLACYAEMTVEKVFYHYSPLMQRELRMLVTIDQFDGAGAAASTFSTWGQSDLSVFPPKTEADISRSYTDLDRSFITAITSFAGYFASWRSKKH